jgi:sec-independent protein translocase protein TatB
MPQIGWFEILIVVILAILIIGPKDIPLVLKTIGNWVGSLKRYFVEVQKDVSDIENTIDDEMLFDKDFSEIKNDKKKDD